LNSNAESGSDAKRYSTPNLNTIPDSKPLTKSDGKQHSIPGAESKSKSNDDIHAHRDDERLCCQVRGFSREFDCSWFQIVWLVSTVVIILIVCSCWRATDWSFSMKWNLSWD
jgi:hypothetical protein